MNSSVTFSMTSASMSLQDNLNTTVVVEGPSTPLMTSHIISTSPCSSSASSMFTEQPSSTYIFSSSSAVYSSMKLPESSPEPNSTQIYNLNGTPTISIHLELHVWPEKNMHAQDSVLKWKFQMMSKFSINVLLSLSFTRGYETECVCRYA